MNGWECCAKEGDGSSGIDNQAFASVQRSCTFGGMPPDGLPVLLQVRVWLPGVLRGRQEGTGEGAAWTGAHGSPLPQVGALCVLIVPDVL